MSSEKIQKIVVTAFIHYDKKVLLVRRAGHEHFLAHFYEMPGGKINFDESPEDALVREVKEETNLDIEVIRIYSLFSYLANNNQIHVIDLQFLAKITSDIAEIKLSRDHTDFKWVSIDELDNYQISDHMKDAIKKGFNELNK